MPGSLDNEHISEWFNNYRQFMYKIAFGILNNKSDAEDAVQNAFLWIIDNLEKILQIPCNERGVYFASIIEHVSIDQLRKQKRHPTDDIDELYDLCSDYSVEGEVLSKRAKAEINNALEDLSNKDYDLLYLYLFREKTPKEIAEIIGIPERNIRVYIKRARERFIKILKKRGVIDDV